MGIVREQVQIDFAAMFGDMVWDHGESVENALKSMRYVNSCIYAAFNGIPNFRDRGNHECLYNGDGLTDEQIFANIFAWNTGAKYDANNRLGGYCYRDFEDYKLRVICINTCESSDGSFAVSNTQNTWLQSALDLSSKGAGWRSIVLGHHPPDWVSSSSNLVQTLKAASGLIAVFHGHVHGYKVDTIPGTEITRIAIPNACFGRENEYGQNGKAKNVEGTEFGEETTYTKTAGSANDTAFCVVTIDLAEKKIYADHYGAGYSRVIPFDDVVLNNYTVTTNLTNVSGNNASTSITEGASYTTTLTANSGYVLDDVTVTMGGTDVTATAYNGGVVSIQNVTGNLVITATAIESTDPEPPSTGTYTNLVRTSKNADGSIYNGTGYQNGYRLNSSGTTTESATAVNCGFIPYSGQVIRVWGTFVNNPANSGNYIGLYDENHQKTYVMSADGAQQNGATWVALDGKYMLTVDPASITDAAIKGYLTEAVYIRCSMENCDGENFVVTLDELIE
jgi:Ni/Co efflux regulator RcnB